MKAGYNILSHLQNHEILPPPEVRGRILVVISDLMNSTEGETRIRMEGLTQLEIQPPAFLRSAIERKISMSAATNGPVKPQTALFPRRSIAPYIASAAAACLLLILSFFAFHRSEKSPLQEPVARNLKIEKAPESVTAPAAVQANDSATEKILARNTAAADSGLTAKPDTHSAPLTTFKVAGQSFELQDNDLMVSFAGFHYGKLPDFMTSDKDQDLTVRIDQFASVHVSKDMRNMMKKMYNYKSNGELTRKARKVRTKLNEWKGSDERHFDNSAGLNPMDPIDLSEFLFK